MSKSLNSIATDKLVAERIAMLAGQIRSSIQHYEVGRDYYEYRFNPLAPRWQKEVIKKTFFQGDPFLDDTRLTVIERVLYTLASADTLDTILSVKQLRSSVTNFPSGYQGYHHGMRWLAADSRNMQYVSSSCRSNWYYYHGGEYIIQSAYREMEMEIATAIFKALLKKAKKDVPEQGVIVLAA